MAGFLYSFAAKDIQNYILRSDKLVEMVGASELIDHLCRENGFLQQCIENLGIANTGYEFITQAAGWAKIKFQDESDALTLYKYWPLAVSLYAPGLHIVQSIIPVNGSISAAINESEKQLIYARNTLNASLPEVGPLINRNPRTGLAAIGKLNDESIDEESKRKRETTTNNLIQRMTGAPADNTWPKKLENIAGSERKYLAIIHADGNSLGKALIAIQGYLDQNKSADAAGIYRGFSNAIDKATLQAVQYASEQVILRNAGDVKAARPIVLGGDDVTIIIRADLAFEFTNVFLSKFEETSEDALKSFKIFKIPDFPDALTACAGIAFVKQAYPFSRAYELAESLCQDAKTAAKAQIKNNGGYVPSCFSFCKISTSIAGDYKTIKNNELTSRDGITKLWFGPYGVGEYKKGIPRYDDLKALSALMEKAPAGTIRELITTMYVNSTTAQSDYERMLQVLRWDKNTKGVADDIKGLMEKLTGSTESLVSTGNQTPLLDAHRYGELQK